MDGYFYSRYGQVGLGEGGSAEIKSYKQLEDGRYEVIFDYCEYQYQVQERTEEYKVIADIQMIDGERMWTFYSVEKIFDMYGD